MSFSNSNGPAAGNGPAADDGGQQDSPSTVTITGVHLGAGDCHWAKMI